jgi:hypothetical protein
MTRETIRRKKGVKEENKGEMKKKETRGQINS